MLRSSLFSTAIVGGLFALVYAFYRYLQVAKQEAGTEKMVAVAQAIKEGAFAFIRREYQAIGFFVFLVAAFLVATQKGDLRLVGISFVAGAFCSALSGFLGMKAATMANVRTANAARTSLVKALHIAFAGGQVMGMCVVGLGLLGITLLFWFFAVKLGHSPAVMKGTVMPVISGFSFGASSIALFARVGGGIFTKGADVGADLVGKLEKGIPEDDPRNPAVVADNVGDNVGDVCGMGADLFESYAGAIVSAMVLAAGHSLGGVILPLILAAIGIFCSILGSMFVKTKEGGNPQTALNRGSLIAGALFVVISYFGIKGFIIDFIWVGGKHLSVLDLWETVVLGLIIGILIGLITEYYCAKGKKPVGEVVVASNTGAATNILAGIGVGMRSTALPLLLIAVGIIISYQLCGYYGIALAGLGMLSTLGIQLAVDAYGPIADNAGGISQMSGLGSEVRARTDSLDAVGNTTAAIGKGFAIGSAALTALAMFAAFREQVGLTSIDITRPEVMAGLLIGGMLPFLFSALSIGAVSKTAQTVVAEVRRQFQEIPGLMEGKAKAEYAHCVDIATKSALKQMVAPGLLAIIFPVAVGFLSKYFFGNVAPLGGLLAGATVTGVVLAIFMANSGGAWDNAKKQIEENGKGSPSHAAAVVGDTVGDPFKDTAGPSLNILIKVMSILSLVLAPLFI